jgi:MFS family permease
MRDPMDCDSGGSKQTVRLAAESGMSVYELRDLSILIAITVLPSAILSLLIGKYRPGWSRRRALILAALPIPGFVWLLCAVLFLWSAFSSKESCGVDACGMAMAASTIVSIYAAVAFGFGLAAAWLVRRLAR